MAPDLHSSTRPSMSDHAGSAWAIDNYSPPFKLCMVAHISRPGQHATRYTRPGMQGHAQGVKPSAAFATFTGGRLISMLGCDRKAASAAGCPDRRHFAHCRQGPAPLTGGGIRMCYGIPPLRECLRAVLHCRGREGLKSAPTTRFSAGPIRGFGDDAERSPPFPNTCQVG